MLGGRILNYATPTLWNVQGSAIFLLENVLLSYILEYTRDRYLSYSKIFCIVFSHPSFLFNFINICKHFFKYCYALLRRVFVSHCALSQSLSQSRARGVAEIFDVKLRVFSCSSAYPSPACAGCPVTRCLDPSTRWWVFLLACEIMQSCVLKLCLPCSCLF